MKYRLSSDDEIRKICADTDVSWGLDALASAFKTLMPDLDFNCVLTRGKWHRLGGVVDKDYGRISHNITEWVEEQAPDGDVDELIVQFTDSGYFATRLAGKTHYFTAQCGSDPQDFIQLEVEELQEVIERPLVDKDWYPDSIEEFLDPLDYPLLDPEPVGKPQYKLRRMVAIAERLDDATEEDLRSLAGLKRFMSDWQSSSANDIDAFCNNWILSIQEYKDSDDNRRFKARPVSTYAAKLPELPAGEELQGAQLANSIHGYDREIGYPFAWYFIMLGSKSKNYQLAKAVVRDQIGAYDYLPPRDVKIVLRWEESPYGV